MSVSASSEEARNVFLAALERAARLSESAPETERLFIQAWLAERQGSPKLAADLLRQLIKLAPDEWHAAFELGQLAYDERNWDLAISAYRRSMEISDQLNKSCVGYNNIGYAQAMVERYDLAILALERCRDLSPREPNPHDSLGEVELAAGRVSEAEAEFQKAFALDPKFWVAMHGLAQVRFYRGEWAAGLAMLETARAAAFRLMDRYTLDEIAAWALLSSRDGRGALARLDALDLDALDKDAPTHAEAAYSYGDAAIHRAAICPSWAVTGRPWALPTLRSRALVKGSCPRASRMRWFAARSAGASGCRSGA